MSKELELARKLAAELEEKERKQKVKLGSLKPGEVFKIGEHDFIVLEQGIAQTKVISKDFMAKEVMFDEDTRDYNKSNLKKVIEEKIQPIIEDAVGEDNIVEHCVDLISVDMQREFDNCKYKVRPITFDEARKYNDLIVNENLENWWWTCTSWSTKGRGWKYQIAVVSPPGYFRRNCCYYVGVVRPFCIFSSSIFESED